MEDLLTEDLLTEAPLMEEEVHLILLPDRRYTLRHHILPALAVPMRVVLEVAAGLQ